MLQTITVAVNFIALLVALWLGLHLVTRSARRPEIWLSSLALWSFGGYFLNQILALIQPPAPPEEVRNWLFHLMLFWPRNVFELGWKGWMQGWLPFYGIIFWYHASLYMVPGYSERGRLLRALPGYIIVFVAILIHSNSSSVWMNLTGDPLFINSSSYSLSPLISLGFVFFAGLSLYNLAKVGKLPTGLMAPDHYNLLKYAILVGILVGLVVTASVLLDIPFPQALTGLLSSITLVLAGIGIARYTAYIEERTFNQGIETNAAEAFGPLGGNNEPTSEEPTSEAIEVTPHLVELALRNLQNYAYLADSQLTNLRIVGRCIEITERGANTHIDRGKALSAILTEALDKLKPGGEEPTGTPARIWHPYIILRDAYFFDEPNREIMSRLYISEGTFNRTRRSAIQSVTRILEEMESCSE